MEAEYDAFYLSTEQKSVRRLGWQDKKAALTSKNVSPSIQKKNLLDRHRKLGGFITFIVDLGKSMLVGDKCETLGTPVRNYINDS